MAKDVLALLVDVVADVGHEIATTLGDTDGRAALMGQAGQTPPATPPPSSAEAAGVLQTLQAKAHAGAESGDADTLELLAELTQAFAVLVSFAGQAADMQDDDDKWSLIATLLDAVALARLRVKQPTLVALLGGLHLVSENRLLFGDAIRARDQWGSFLLGHPADDDAKADNLSIIIGAAFAALGLVIPFEDDKGKHWVRDMLFGWDPNPLRLIRTRRTYCSA